MSNKGFSVVSVLVASIFLSLIMAASLKMMHYAALTANTNEARLGLSNLAQDARGLVKDGKLSLASVNLAGYNIKNVTVKHDGAQLFIQGEAVKPILGPKLLKPRLVATITDGKNHGHEMHEHLGDCKHD